jgi:hypothetical protein
MKANHVILGVHITNRLKNAAEVQKVFTDFGCHIKTRLGLHEVTPEYCAGEGIVLLEIVGGDDVREQMVKQLGAIDGIEVREMVFRHE